MKTKSKTKILQLKITLKDIKPSIWRKILVEDTITFRKFHYILQIVMGWGGGHLHEFSINNYAIGPTEDDDALDYKPDLISDRKITLQEVISDEKEKFTYNYDFGNDWEHIIVVEKILPKEDKKFYPVCLNGSRACPPEDCGGPWGYDELLKILADKKHPQHKEQQQWLEDVMGYEEGYDAEFFDVAEINEILQYKSSSQN
ncbi:MAG: plasmid pRiA4b ORF-3 family protein [Bacteroidota bacterium]